MNEAIVIIGGILLYMVLFLGIVVFDEVDTRQATLKCVTILKDKPAMEINLLCRKNLAQ